MAQQKMFSAKLGSPQTTLAATLEADATSMVLTDASVLPAATTENPNIAVLGVDENCEIVKYTAIDTTTNTVSGLVRGQGDSTARVWEAGSVVARNATSLDHDIFKANIEDLETRKSNTGHTHDDLYYTESEMDTKLAEKAPLASPAFTGTPTAPTATRGTNTTQIASTAFVQDALVTSFRDVYKVTLPSVSSSKRTFTANGITADHEMVVEGFAYFSNPSAVTGSTLTITTATNSITVTGNLAGTTDIIVTLGIPRSLTAS